MSRPKKRKLHFHYEVHARRPHYLWLPACGVSGIDTVTRTLSACRAYHLCGLSSLARLSPPIKPSLSPWEDYLNIQWIVVFYPVLYAHEAVFHTQSSRLQPLPSLFTPGDLLSCCQSASAGPRISSCRASLLTCHALWHAAKSQHKCLYLSLIHIWRCRRASMCRSRWSPYH